MAKQNILYDINGIQICVGDKIAVVSSAGYGAPKYTLEQGTVIKLNGASIRYRTEQQVQYQKDYLKRNNLKQSPKNDHFFNTKQYTEQCVLVLEGEFIPKTKCNCGCKTKTSATP